jgi:purine-binding chemotaxis protein CheW
MKKRESQDSISLNDILERLRNEYWKNISEREIEEKLEGFELLTFWLADENYGVDLSFSRHLLKIPRIVKLPQVPAYISGVFNLRGDIIAVLDLRVLFGMQVATLTDNSRLLVVESKGVSIALLLDRIGDIVLAETKNLQKITTEQISIPSQFLKGYFLPSREKEKILIYLDLEQLLASEKIVAGFKEG